MMEIAPTDYFGGGAIDIRALIRLGGSRRQIAADDPNDLRNFNWQTRLVAAIGDMFGL